MGKVEEALKDRKLVVVLHADNSIQRDLSSLADQHGVPRRTINAEHGRVILARHAARRAVALAATVDLSGASVVVRPSGLLLFTNSDIVVREVSLCLMINHINGLDGEDWGDSTGYLEDETALNFSRVAVFHSTRGSLAPVEVTKHGFRIPGEDEEMAKMSALEQDCFHAIDEMKDAAH